MPFEPGKSGNPTGRPMHRAKDGRTLAELAREHTEEAIATLVEVMRDKTAPPVARVTASDKILNRGWGQAPQTIAVGPIAEPLDLSGMTDEQIDAIRTLRALAPLDAGSEPLH